MTTAAALAFAAVTTLAPASGLADTAAVLRRSRQATLAGAWDDALRELRAAARQAEGEGRRAEQALLLSEVGRVALERSFYFRRDEAGAEALIRDSLAFADTSGAERARALALLQMARLSYAQARDTGSRWEVAVDYAQRALQSWEALREPAEVAGSLYILGLVRQMRDGREQGVEEFEKMRTLAESAGDHQVTASAERHLGYAYEARHDYARALRHYERSLALLEQAGARVNVPFARITLADLRWQHLGERSEPIAILERAIVDARRARSVRAEYTARLALGRYLGELGRHEDALRHARLALAGTKAYAAATAGRTAETLIETLTRARPSR
jgi:tetratricopeptide (TPR) repeat protein